MGPSAIGRVSSLLFLVAGAIAAVGVVAPRPQRVNIRWVETITLAQRVAAEQSLRVERGVPLESGTWSYEVPDVAIISRIVTHPLVADTHHIDRQRLTFSDEFPEARARLRQRYHTAPFAFIAARWRLLSAALSIVAMFLAWPGIRATFRSASDRVWLPLILAVSLIARVVIVMSGGQYYSPDEDRYKQSQQMVEDFQANDLPAVWGRAMTSGHPLFKLIGMLPAGFEAKYGRDPRAPALFFALFSVINIWLAARIARRLDATGTEVVWVTLLFAAATSFLFYARHLFPYDIAMTFGLLALLAAAAPAGRWRASIACGLLSGLAFLTYFGSWTFGASVCAVLVFGGTSAADMARRGLLAVTGLAAPLLMAVGVSRLTGEDFFARLREFSAQVTQGSFAEGWRLPLEYFWHTEHALLLLWVAATAWGVVRWRSYLSARTVRSGLIGLACLYSALAVLSTGLHLYVVYGRLARQLVPYLSLVAGTVLARTFADHARRRVALSALAMLVVAQAAFNARQVFSQQFPADFIVEGEQVAGRRGASRAVTLYTAHLYPPVKIQPPPGYVEVLAARHPLQFIPFQYEGFSPEQRQLLRSEDFRMRVLIPGAEQPK